MTIRIRRLIALAATLTLPLAALSAGVPDVDATLKDVESTFGTVPGFVKQFPRAALPGAWAELKGLELNPDTAIPMKYKALISLAVAAQIPCHYCVWADTGSARQAGASDEEIAEAVAMAAITRHWSTVLNGLQVDFDTYKKELGGPGAK